MISKPLVYGGVDRMATAYVLINCELGSEESIIEHLKGIEGVKEVHGTFGAYDVLAKLNLMELKNYVRQ